VPGDSGLARKVYFFFENEQKKPPCSGLSDGGTVWQEGGVLPAERQGACPRIPFFFSGHLGRAAPNDVKI